VITSGEALSSKLVKDYYLKLKVPLHNLYGPTEASIDVTSFECSSDSIAPNIPIGKPISNTEIYILDSLLNPVPVGIAGEIYIDGVGLARGYLNRPGLTAERFIPNPFGRGSRLYKTGDLGRYLFDGNIEFLGRNDYQVKLRGFRIELGEIERAIETAEAVQQAIVLCREDLPGQKRLVAYVVSRNKEDSGLIESLQSLCQSHLPDYMQPSQWVILDEMPLTSNGKVDRKKLPAPEGREGLGIYQAPEGEIEERLAKIWSDLLGVERISRTDNFFQVGGDSIVSIQLVSRARQQGMVFSVKQVFETPTLASLALHVKEDHSVLASQELAQGKAPLSPIQRWFFDQAPVEAHHYNQAMWVKSEETIDLDRLQHALKEVYHHHDAFRLRYKKGSEGWEQYYAEEESPLPWEVLEKCSQKDFGDICTDLQAGLNIEQGPLSRLIWFAEKKQLLWVIHHLIVDGVSWRILLEDLNLAYAGKALGSKSHSYRDWSESLSRYTPATTEYEYYQTQLQTISKLPTDYSYNGYTALRDVQNLNITFSEETTKQFLQKAHQSYGTQPDDLLLLALVQAAGDCFGKYELCLDLEGHGREDLGEHLDLTRTLGWFTSMHPIILTLLDPSDMDQSIKHIKEHLRHIPQKGVAYGILSKIQNSCSFVQGDILFNYLGQWSNTKRNEEAFFFGEEDTGLTISLDNPLSHPLVINGSVAQGRLGFHWSYSTHHYKRETIEKFSKAFKERLETLVDYCSEEKHFGYSPSDFPHVKLRGNQLDNLLKKIGNMKQ
jgi:non-ribosomal peptide synthase protein (TIGR01720 family)